MSRDPVIETKPRRTTARRIAGAFGLVLFLFALALAVMIVALDRIGTAEREVERLDRAKHAGHHAAAMAREQYMHQRTRCSPGTIRTWITTCVLLDDEGSIIAKVPLARRTTGTL